MIGAAHAGWRGAFTGVLEAPSRRWSAAAPTARASWQCSARPSGKQNYEVGTGIRRTVHGGRRAKRPLFPAGPARAATPCSICRATSWHGSARPASAGSRISAAAPTRIRRGSSATGARPTPRAGLRAARQRDRARRLNLPRTDPPLWLPRHRCRPEFDGKRSPGNLAVGARTGAGKSCKSAAGCWGSRCRAD